jgi:hypothetical protein
MIYEMGVACTALVGKGGGKKHLVRQGLDGIVMCSLTGCVNVGWIQLAYHMVHWLNIFHMVMDICFLGGGKLIDHLSHFWLLKEDYN